MIGNENEQISPRSSGSPFLSSPLSVLFRSVTRCAWLCSSRETMIRTFFGALRRPATEVSIGIAMWTWRAGASGSKNGAIAKGTVGALIRSGCGGRHVGLRYTHRRT